MGDTQNIAARDLTKEEKWIVTWSSQGYKWIWLLWWNSVMFWRLELSWGIQMLRTEISNTKYPSAFIRQACILQRGCMIEYLSWKIQTFSLLPDKYFCRRLHTTFLVSVCYDWEKTRCMDEFVWKANSAVHDSFLNIYGKRNACKTASCIDLGQVRPNQALGIIHTQT